eukprot:2072705-Pleurochrysis_carterae.AAC.1
MSAHVRELKADRMIQCMIPWTKAADGGWPTHAETPAEHVAHVHRASCPSWMCTAMIAAFNS